MKKITLLFTLILTFLLSAPMQVQAQTLAFPGAEGFGRYAKGARGVAAPEVYHVTNLNDSGSGSLRDAVSKPGRVVVFDVSGVIKLNSRLVFSGNSYIAGQTAPGDGIILYGNGVSFSGASNLIVRHLRIYMGKGGDSGKDAAGIANGSDMIFDHLSTAWGLDENFSVNWDGKGTEPGNITIQNTIIGQGILTHSCGGLIQTNNGISIIGCLYIDNKTRNPKVKGLNQFINNVVYNWGGSNGYIFGDTDASSWGWLEGNYFIAGPGSSSSPYTRTTSAFQLYQKDNFVDSNKDGVLNGDASANSAFGSVTHKTSPTAFTGIPKAHPAIAGGILSAQDALNRVITSVGASLPARSHVDDYMINELLSYGKKGAFLGHERDNGIPNNIGVISTGVKPLDSDNDGMPDAWEDANGLNKNSAADAVQVASNGYLNIENYINSLNGPVAEYVRCASELEFVERTTSSVTIKWKNNSSDADQIVVQKSTDNKTFTDAATVTGTETSCIVSGLNEDTYYYFRLISKKSGLADSTPSGVLRETTSGQAKAPDKALNPAPAIDETSRFYTSVTFSWEENTRPWGGDIKYDVYFGSSADNMTKVASGISAKSYTHTTMMNMNATYYWRVDNTNNVGTTTGDVWQFKAGEYSFESSFVDFGVSFDGSKAVNPKSGIKLSTSKTYTINNEMTFTISGSGASMSTTDSKDNLYGNGDGGTSSTKYAYIKMTAAADYIQGVLTSTNTKKNIVSMCINGTSADVATGSVCFVLFSDGLNFNTKSIIGYEQIDIARCRCGEEAIEIVAPIGTKSFRVQSSATLGVVDEGVWEIGGSNSPMSLKGSGQLRIGYVGATLELLSFDGEGGEKDTDNSISAATINGKTANVVKSTGAISANFRYGTATGAWPVTFTLSSQKATADFTSGNTHDFSQGPLTINVTAQNGDTKAYTVTANVMQKPTIGMLTATGKAETTDDLFLSAFSDYDVVFLTASTTAPADINAFFDAYNLIVVHANVGGDNATLMKVRQLVGVRPILNMKAYCYTNTSGKERWAWGAPSNSSIGAITSQVETALQNHNIFAGVTFEGQNLTFYKEPTTVINGIQYLTALSGTNWTTAIANANQVLAKYGTGTHIHEVNLNNAAKYILIGLSNEGDSYAKFNTNTVTLLKNAAAYLLNPLAYYDYANNLPVGIDSPDAPAISNLKFYDGVLYNPEGEAVSVYNLSGSKVLTSSETSINVSGLPSGIYMAVSASGSLKFIK